MPVGTSDQKVVLNLYLGMSLEGRKYSGNVYCTFYSVW